MALYLAIDAGGTHTRCLLADDTRVLARASTGTVKLMRASEQEATARLQSVLEEVARSASVLLSDVTRTCFGLAGISSPAVRAWAGKTISTLVSGQLILCGDEEIALDAAFEGGPGILVIAGTGNNAIGRSASGSLFGAGGWGPVLGDEGSGYWIGLKAIRAAIRAEDRMELGGGSTCLLREIERHFNVTSLAELVALANQCAEPQHPALDFASLAPVVARCAEQGDSLAAGLLERAGGELAELVAVVYHKMNAATATNHMVHVSHSSRVCESELQADSLPWREGQVSKRSLTADAESASAVQTFAEPAGMVVAFTGSVLSRIAAVRVAMIARLAHALPNARVRQSAVDPLEGALWRARNP